MLPDAPEGYLERGMLNVNIGNLEQARSDFERAQSLGSEDAPMMLQALNEQGA
jgi:uncharacterized membrane-anchored protein